MRDWQKEAPIWIADATKDLPESATLKERRAALRKVGYRFHGFTSWGRRVWSKFCRAHLEKHGLPPRTIASAAPTSKIAAKLAAPDITFPFRPAP